MNNEITSPPSRGGHEPGRRSALAFSFDVHPTWFGNDALLLTLLLGIGYELQ